MHYDLNTLGLIDEEEIALDLAALSLALLDHSDADLAPSLDLLDAMETRLQRIGGAAETPAERAEALMAVLGREFGLPGHVLVLIGAEAAPIIVDPFAGGVPVGVDRLAALATAFAEPGRATTQVAAMPNRAVLVRLLQNQASRAERAGNGRRALELYVRMTIMAPAFPHAWWERARLELVDHDVSAARSSLGAMLEITRDPELRRQVADTLSALPAG